MRKLVESTFVTLDGVFSSPEKWGPPYWDDEHNQYAHDLLFAADALLLGRQTYEGFVGAWPSRTGEYSERINSLPKYVASRTLTDAAWTRPFWRATSPKPSPRSRRSPGDNILKFGTGELDRALLKHKLVDEYHFWVFPLVAGSGERLFEGLQTTVELVGTTRLGSGIIVLKYSPK